MSEDLTPVNAEQEPSKNDDGKESVFTRFKNWLLDSYNGLFKIVIQPQLPKARFILLGTIAFLLGMVWAYNIAPVQFFDASPSELSQGARDQWVKFVANSYPESYDDETTVQLLEQIEDPVGAIDRIIAADNSPQPTQITVNLQNIRPLAEQAQPGTSAPSGGTILSSILAFVLAIIGYIIIINVFALLWGLLIGGFVERGIAQARKRIFGETEADKQASAMKKAIQDRREMEKKMKEEAADSGAEFGAPIMQRISPYQKGRAYDDSFAIEDPNDMFLGECGATIKKTIGDNELSVIEIWLFDKDDFVRTLTKFFATEHAFNDPVTRSELEGEVENPATDIVMLAPDATIQISTDNILVQAKVADMIYGSDPSLPPNSYIETINLRMEAWDKSGSVGGTATPAPVPVPAAASGLPSLDSYEIGPPPAMPSMGDSATQSSASPVPPPPPAGARSLDEYEIGPPPDLPTSNETTQAPPPPPASPLPGQQDQQDDDPFGGTGDFTPINQ